MDRLDSLGSDSRVCLQVGSLPAFAHAEPAEPPRVALCGWPTPTAVPTSSSRQPRVLAKITANAAPQKTAGSAGAPGPDHLLIVEHALNHGA
jgi:hypothetical protein